MVRGGEGMVGFPELNFGLLYMYSETNISMLPDNPTGNFLNTCVTRKLIPSSPGWVGFYAQGGIVTQNFKGDGVL